MKISPTSGLEKQRVLNKPRDVGPMGVVSRGARGSAPGAAGPSCGFTMMEIAISVAIIGIALVAIIGVLPYGMNVQQANRQETTIDQDASVYMEAIRNGTLGFDDLTNYVYAITNNWTSFAPASSGGAILAQGNNGYTYSQASIATGYPNYPNGQPLTNGVNIIGLMSTPEYIGPTTVGTPNQAPIPSLYFGGISNHVVAYCYSMSGPAMEKPPQDNSIVRQDSFGYRIYCVNSPQAIATNEFFLYSGPWSSATAYVTGDIVFYNWTYWRALADSTGITPQNASQSWVVAPDYALMMAVNIHELRLSFEWPQLANGTLGPGRQSFRTLVAGQLQIQPPYTSGTIYYNPNLFFYQSQSFTNAP